MGLWEVGRQISAAMRSVARAASENSPVMACSAEAPFTMHSSSGSWWLLIKRKISSTRPMSLVWQNLTLAFYPGKMFAHPPQATWHQANDAALDVVDRNILLLSAATIPLSWRILHRTHLPSLSITTKPKIIRRFYILSFQVYQGA